MRNFITALLVSLILTFYGVIQVYAAGITVTNSSDATGSGDGCTLREAIVNANSNAQTNPDCAAGTGTDTITFNLPANSTITLAGTQLVLTDKLLIDGSTAAGLRVSGNNASRVFDIQASAVITMQHLSVVSGTVVGDNGGGIRLNPNARLTLDTVTVSGNSAVLGGGIYNNDARLTINNSTLANNSASEGGGGLAVARNITTLNNVTVSGNTTPGSSGGGGILQDRGTLTINNGTIASNTNATLAGGIRSRRGTLNLRNTLVANNGDTLAFADVNLHTSVTVGADVKNLIERGNFGTPVSTHDPLLGPLQNNGGATLTHPLRSGSPAIDSGDGATCLTSDQIGQARPVGGSCDIGSFENPIVATCFAKLNTETSTFAGWDAEPVRQALKLTGSGTLVKVAGTCAGISLQGGTTQVAYITKTLTIRGGYNTSNWITPNPVANPTTLDAQNGGRVLRVDGAITVNIENFWLQRGLWTAAGNGGGVLINNAAVTISGTTIISSSVTSAGAAGGGLWSNRDVSLINSQLIGNSSAGSGGGLYVSRSASLTNCRVLNNTAGGNGGGLQAQENLVLLNSLVLDNRAANHGGGVYVRGNSLGSPSQVLNSLVAANRAGSGRGSGLYLLDSSGSGQVNVVHTTVASPTVGSGSAIYVNNAAGTVRITNTILTNYATGVHRNSGTVSENYNLFFGNTTDRTGVTAGPNSFNGNPLFVNAAGGDYHLANGSAAVDKATQAGVTNDFEGQARPQGFDPDIGFDESPFISGVKNCYTSLGVAIQFGSNDAQAVRDAIAAAAPGSTVKIAGVCAGTALQEGTAQVAYIGKSLTIQGGYTATNWLTPDPVANPTILDAKGTGRVLRVNGSFTVNIENLHIRNGLWTTNLQHGGGLLANNATVVISGTTFSNNAVTGNSGNGGGLFSDGALTVTNAHFIGNSANWLGGGIFAQQDLRLTNSRLIGNFTSNPSQAGGAGFYVVRNAYLTNSLLRDNRTPNGFGGGGFVIRTISMTNTQIISNSASFDGGGLYLLGTGGSSRIVNSLIAANSAAGRGSGLYLFDSNGSGGQIDIFHTTLAHPSLGSGAAIYVNRTNSTVNLRNSIVANYAIGLHRIAGTVSENYNLFFGNNTDRIGLAAGANSLNGDPDFVNAALEDYHLGNNSAAIDNGANLGITTDFEGQARPLGNGFDRGFDESTLTNNFDLDLVLVKSVQPARVQPGQPIVFTLQFSATGQSGLATQVTITDTIPASVTNTSFTASGAAVSEISPGYVWRVEDLAPGQGGVITVTGVVKADAPAGVFTNTATIAAAQADDPANNSSTVEVIVEEPAPAPKTTALYLPFIMGNFAPTVDLVIDELVATSSAVTVTVRNAGSVTLTDAFWVDVYFNPSQTPRVNKAWPAIASHGVVWGVTQSLAPNESLVLTIGGPYYSPKYSSNLPLPAEATVYGLADSINYATTFGNVPESSETNNLFGPVTSTTATLSEMGLAGASASSPEALPER